MHTVLQIYVIFFWEKPFQSLYVLQTLIHKFRVVFRTLSNVYGGAFFAKIVNGCKLLTVFVKKLHHRYLKGSWKQLWNLLQGSSFSESLILFIVQYLLVFKIFFKKITCQFSTLYHIIFSNYHLNSLRFTEVITAVWLYARFSNSAWVVSCFRLLSVCDVLWIMNFTKCPTWSFLNNTFLTDLSSFRSK